MQLVISQSYHKNQNYKFLPDDSQELFQTNQKILSKEWRFHYQDIDYNINKHGLRCEKEIDEIDWKNAIVLVGCSQTFGIGLPYNETIGYKLEKKTNRPVINLGTSGAGNDALFFNACSIQKYKPFCTVVLWTYTQRLFFYKTENNGSVSFITTHNYKDCPYDLDLTEYLIQGHDLTGKLNLYQTILEDLLQDKYLSNLDVTKETKVWHKLWAEKNMIEYKNLPLNFLKNIKFINECQARDLCVSHKGSTTGHFGFFQTDIISDNILSDYKAKTGTSLCIKS